MASNQLSALSVKNAKVESGEKLLADGDGLYLRVRPANKAWIFIYVSADGGRKKISLGSYPTHSLESARKWAAEQRRLRDEGADPQRQREIIKSTASAKQIKTVAALLDAYVAELKGQGKQSSKDVASIFENHVPRSLVNLPAADVQKRDITPVIRSLVDAGKVRTATKLRSYLRSAFEIALHAEDNPSAPATMLGFGLSMNPVAGVQVPKGGAGKPGEVALSIDEFRVYWNEVNSFNAGDIRDLLILQVLTGGQRISQLAAATLGEVNGKAVMVILDSKGRREEPRRHVVPLVPEALMLIEARGGLFGLTKPEDIDRMKFAASSRVNTLAKRLEKEGVTSFRLGDIRRTIETVLASQGISTDTRAQLLSHGLSGVQARHYDRHDYLPEKRAAIQLLIDILTGQRTVDGAGAVAG